MYLYRMCTKLCVHRYVPLPYVYTVMCVTLYICTVMCLYHVCTFCVHSYVSVPYVRVPYESTVMCLYRMCLYRDVCAICV